ncbi:hypothetical protein COCNU_scaffold001272G000020 [Cocos nucifera]|nr:hypothetical protein [Cocos nucifera]
MSCPAKAFHYNGTLCACEPGYYYMANGNCVLFEVPGGGGNWEVNSGIAPEPTFLTTVLPLENIKRFTQSQAVLLEATLVVLILWLAFCLAIRFGKVDGGKSIWFRLRWWISRLDFFFDTKHWLMKYLRMVWEGMSASAGFAASFLGMRWMLEPLTDLPTDFMPEKGRGKYQESSKRVKITAPSSTAPSGAVATSEAAESAEVPRPSEVLLIAGINVAGGVDKFAEAWICQQNLNNLKLPNEEWPLLLILVVLTAGSDDQKVVVKRKTELGGTFSVASWMLFVGLLSALLYQVITKRSIEVHRVRPANAPDLLSFVNDLEFNVTTISSMSCSQLRGLDTLVIGTPGFIDYRVFPLSTYVSYNCQNTSRGPTISLKCNSGQIPRRNHYISWQFVDLPNDPATAVGFQFNLTAKDHGDDRHVSFVSGTMKSESNTDDKLKTFRGPDLNILKIHLFPQAYHNKHNLKLIQPLIHDFIPGSSFSEASDLQVSLQTPKDGLINTTLYISYLSDYIVEIDNENVTGPVSFLADVGGLYAISLAIFLYLLLQLLSEQSLYSLGLSPADLGVKPEELEMLKKDLMKKRKASSSAVGQKKSKMAAEVLPAPTSARTKVVLASPTQTCPSKSAASALQVGGSRKSAPQVGKDNSTWTEAATEESDSSSVGEKATFGDWKVVHRVVEESLFPTELERMEGLSFLNQQKEAFASILKGALEKAKAEKMKVEAEGALEKKRKAAEAKVTEAEKMAKGQIVKVGRLALEAFKASPEFTKIKVEFGGETFEV